VNQRRRTTVNCRSIVETAQTTSKLDVYVNPGEVCSIPAYGTDGVRHRGSVSLVQVLMLNCGNLRLRCEGKDTSRKCKVDSTDAQPRGGVASSSVEFTVMVKEQSGHVIQSCGLVNCESRRSIAT
jgi:hypothetical protein